MASKVVQARVSDEMYTWVAGHGGMKRVLVEALEMYRERIEGGPVLQPPKIIPVRDGKALTQAEASALSATGQSRKVMGVYVPIEAASEEVRGTWPVRTWERDAAGNPVKGEGDE